MKNLIIIYFFLICTLFPQQRWEKLKGPEGGVISALIAKGDTLVAGTGYYKALIFYSTNRGSTWNKADFKKAYSGNQSRINDFVFTVDGGIIAAVGLHGLFKSFDLVNWTRVLYNNKDFWSIGDDYLSNLYSGTDNGFIYSSSNLGINWNLMSTYDQRIDKFLKIDDNTFAGAYRGIFRKNVLDSIWIQLKLDTVGGHLRPFTDEQGNIFYYSFPKIFKSTNLGDSWTSKGNLQFFWGNSDYDCIFNGRVIAAMGDETHWFGNGWGIALSDDEGLTWRWSNSGFPPKFNAAFRLSKSGTDTYVGTNAAGVYKSSNFGENWFPVNNGINASTTLDLTFDSQGNMYTASWSNGIHKSTDKGVSWKVINNGLTNSYLLSIICDNNDNLFAGTEEGTFRSTDKGENWSKMDSRFFIHLFKDKYNRLYGLEYGGGIYRSDNDGFSWTRLDYGFISGFVYGFAIDKNNNLYAGTLGGAIYKSVSDGNWAKVYQSSNANSFVVHIAIAENGYIYATNQLEGILRSTDNGLTWLKKKTDTGYLDHYRGPIAITKKGTIFASGSKSKFYSSTNDGDTWTDVTNNLSLTAVLNITFDNEGKMYLATDESVWAETPDSLVNITEDVALPKEYSLSQNYPNPFNPLTTIKYSIPTSGYVTIKVFTILGKEISLLVNENKNTGSYDVSFDGSKFPSGVYFYRIQAGKFSETRKMILLK